MRRILRFFVSCVVILLISMPVLPQQASTRPTGRDLTPSRLITFNGTLKDSNGLPRPGNVGITFALYASQEGGTALWQESQSVQTDEQGRYTIFLGATEKEGLPLEVFSSGKAQWLGVQVQGEEEQPRVLLVAVPYALKAADAETVGGRPLTSFVLYEDLAKIIEKQVTPAMIVAQTAVPGAGGVSSTTGRGSPAGTGQGTRVPAKAGGSDQVYKAETTWNTYYGLYSGMNLNEAGGGRYNSFFGYYSGGSTSTGQSNSFFGDLAGNNNTGSNNSFFGASAGVINASGGNNSFFGYRAGFSNTASGNSFVGYKAGYANAAGSANAFFGSEAGAANTTAGNNSFFGYHAGYANTEGTDNSFFGMEAGLSNTEADYNSFFGRSAGRSNTGSENSFFGAEAGFSNTTVSGNSFFGRSAGRSNTTGSNNSFFGKGAGQANVTGYQNSYFGASAGTVSTGYANAFFGDSSGISNTTGYWNAFLGAGSGYSNTTGQYNLFAGTASGLNNTSGSRNTFIGYYAGYSGAGGSNTVENYNTLIGALTLGAAGISNATAIGYQARVTQSNSLVLGSINGTNGSTADTNVGIGTTAPGGKLHVKGGANEIFYVGTNGLIGIGTSTPDRKLQIVGGALGNAEIHIGGAGDELHDVFSGMGVDVSTGPAFNYGYSGSSFGRSSGFFNVRPDPSAIAPNPSLRFMTVNQQRMIITNTGNVGIGTSAPTEKLHVVGNFRLSGTIITGAPEEPVPDYVFEPGYKLMPIEDLQRFVQKEKHLPNVPNAGEIREKGLNLGGFQMKLLEKIEELTLYTVQQSKAIGLKDAKITALEEKNTKLEARLATLEQMMESISRQKERR